MFIVVQKRVIQKWKLKFTVQSTVCRDWLGTAFLSFLSWCFQRWRRIMVSSLSLCSEEFWGPWFGFFFPFLTTSMKAALATHACSLLLCLCNSVGSRLWIFVPSYWFLHALLLGSEKRERGGLCHFHEPILAEGTWDLWGAKRVSIVEFQTFHVIVEILEILYKGCS